MRLERIQRFLERRGMGLAAGLAMGAFVFFLIRIVLPSTQTPHGFVGNYVTSLLLIQGKLGPWAYDNEWFIQQVQTITRQPLSEVLSPSLPTVSLMAIPFALLPLQAARTSWIWFNLVILMMGLGVLMVIDYRLNQQSPRWPLWLTFATLVWLFPPVAANFLVGQSIVLFFCLFTLTLLGLLTQREWLAGLTLGLALILKTTGVPLWLLFLMQRRWKALVWGAGTVSTVALLSLPWIGIDTWEAYIQAVWRVTNSPTAAVTAYQTTTGFFSHLFRFDPVWNPTPLHHWPVLVGVFPPLIALFALTLTLWVGKNERSTTDLFAALIPLSVVLLPVAEEHHFIILLIPIFVLITTRVKDLPAAGFPLLDGIWLALALFLLIAPIPYEYPALSVGWLALFAYPRLYGAWLIWGLAIRRMLKKQRHLLQHES